MEVNTETTDQVTCRRALEALRSGVPNSDAVQKLGCNQPQADSRFAGLLDRAADVDNPPSGALGMLVSGEFGAGKSHLLTHLEHRALSEGFVCSKVAVSKETPLYDLGKVFKSAVDNGRMPDRSGRLVEGLGEALHPDSGGYVKFFRWANDADESGLSTMFPASLLIYERSRDLELNSEIESFWAGDRMTVSTVKDGLRKIGQLQSFPPFRAPKAAELPPQRLRFFIELIKAAGYKGWVVLLDEIELVASYSLLQRGRSYAELARWQGQSGGGPYPGLVTVGAITGDFASAVIGIDGKMDRDNVKPRLERSRPELVSDAETGMRLLESGCLALDPLTDAAVRETMDRLRQVYSAAYGSDAPPREDQVRGAGEYDRMRYHVRAAINAWDLLRLYPDARPETESDDCRFTYEEDPDLERETRDDQGGDGQRQAEPVC